MTPREITIATVVDDMPRTLAFYRAVGIAIPAGADTDDYVVVHLQNGDRMSWNTVAVERSFNPDWAPPQEAGRLGLSFRLPSPADVDATHDRLVAMGFDTLLPPFDAPWDNRHCRMLDPDGNAIDLFAEPNSATHQHAQRHP